jgi:hypothetical protein
MRTILKAPGRREDAIYENLHYTGIGRPGNLVDLLHDHEAATNLS